MNNNDTILSWRKITKNELSLLISQGCGTRRALQVDPSIHPLRLLRHLALQISGVCIPTGVQ